MDTDKATPYCVLVMLAALPSLRGRRDDALEREIDKLYRDGENFGGEAGGA